MNEVCSICGNPAEVSDPRGWGILGASAPECLPCAIRDGWILEVGGLVQGIPYADWTPSPDQIQTLVEAERAKRTR